MTNASSAPVPELVAIGPICSLRTALSRMSTTASQGARARPPLPHRTRHRQRVLKRAPLSQADPRPDQAASCGDIPSKEAVPQTLPLEPLRSFSVRAQGSSEGLCRSRPCSLIRIADAVPQECTKFASCWTLTLHARDHVLSGGHRTVSPASMPIQTVSAVRFLSLRDARSAPRVKGLQARV